MAPGPLNPTFIPSRDGLHFTNRFPNVILPADALDSFLEGVLGAALGGIVSGIPVIGPILGPILGGSEGLGTIIGTIVGAKQSISVGGGRCGGFAWLALDYWFAGVPIPTVVDSDAGGPFQLDDFAADLNDMPADNTPLSTAIYNRLMDSLQTNTMFVQTGAWCLNESDQDVAQKTTANEFPRVQSAIDSGHPVVLSMISRNNNLGELHQVVAIGYSVASDGTMTVNIYDVNFPDADTIVLTAKPNQPWAEFDTTGALNASIQADHTTLPWKGWFVEEYSSKPPPFVDIEMASTYTLTETPQQGTPFELTCNWTNAGPYPAHAPQLRLIASDFFSTTVLAIAQTFATEPDQPIAPGTNFTFSFNTRSLNLSGPNTIALQYQTLENHWLTVPATQAFPNPITINVEEAAVVALTVGSVTTGLNAQGQAIALVSCSAVTSNFNGPSTITWLVDEDAAGSGAQINLQIPLGFGPTFQPKHTIVVTAATTGADPISRSDSQIISIPVLTATMALSDPLSSVGASVTTSRLQGALAVTTTENGYSTIAIEASASNGVGAVKFAWQPKPDKLQSNGAVAFYQFTPKGSAADLESYEGESLTVSLRYYRSSRANRFAK